MEFVSIAAPGGDSPALGPRARRRRRAAALLAVAGVLGCAGAGVWWIHGRAPQTPAGDGIFTLYVLGSSTALGYPYFPQANVGKIARLCVDGKIAGRPVRVVNVAGPGKTARVTLRDAAELVRRRPAAGLSAAFVYVGNNEFLRFDRRHDLRQQERRQFDTAAVTPEERDRVITRYEAQLQETLATLRDAGIRPYVSTVAINLKDWEPNRSVLREVRNAAVVQALLDSAGAARAAGNGGRALQAYGRILELEPHFALASYRAGICALEQGRRAAARAALQAAADDDGNPLRDTSEMTHAIWRAAARTGTPVVDAVKILNEASPDSVLGDEMLWDNCHPKLEGYTRLAVAWATALREQFDCTVRVPAQEELRAELGIDAAVDQDVLHREGQYAYGASTLVFDPGPRLARARALLERADAMSPSADVKCSIAVLEALAGHVPAALDAWQKARTLDPEVARNRMSSPAVQQIMARHGVPDVTAAQR